MRCLGRRILLALSILRLLAAPLKVSDYGAPETTLFGMQEIKQIQNLGAFTTKSVRKVRKLILKPYHYILLVLEIKSLVSFRVANGISPTVIGDIQKLGLIALRWLIGYFRLLMLSVLSHIQVTLMHKN
jgi:hypothetical protein